MQAVQRACLGLLARFVLPTLAVVGVGGIGAPALAQLTERVSVATDGTQVNDASDFRCHDDAEVLGGYDNEVLTPEPSRIRRIPLTRKGTD